MEKLNFSYNWNNKLNCKAFTTIRLHNPSKYRINNKLEIVLNNEVKGIATVQNVTRIKIENINNYIANIDTGYNDYECVAILKRMYKNKGIDWSSQILDFVLLKYDK